MFKPLERSAAILSEFFVSTTGTSTVSYKVLGAATKPVAGYLVDTVSMLPFGGYLSILLGIGMIMLAVIQVGKLLQAKMTGRAQDVLTSAVGRNRLTGVASGTAVTVLVQSSSTTTSLILPLAGAGVLTTRQVFPFTMGANIGTCITALLAAMGVFDSSQSVALQIALVHLLYNVFGVVLFLLVPWLYSLPVRSAEWLGELTEKNRAYALGYLLAVFFVLPGAVFGFSNLFLEDGPLSEEQGEVVRETARDLEDRDILLE